MEQGNWNQYSQQKWVDQSSYHLEENNQQEQFAIVNLRWNSQMMYSNTNGFQMKNSMFPFQNGHSSNTSNMTSGIGEPFPQNSYSGFEPRPLHNYSTQQPNYCTQTTETVSNNDVVSTHSNSNQNQCPTCGNKLHADQHSINTFQSVTLTTRDTFTDSSLRQNVPDEISRDETSPDTPPRLDRQDYIMINKHYEKDPPVLFQSCVIFNHSQDEKEDSSQKIVGNVSRSRKTANIKKWYCFGAD